MIQRYISNFTSFHIDIRRYLLGAFLFNIGASISDLLYTLYLNSLGYADSFIGGIISLHAFGVLTLCIPAAFLARKFSHRTMLFWSVALASFFYSLRAIFPNESFIPFFNFAGGAAVSAARVIPAVLLIRFSKPSERAFVFGLNAALGMFGIMIGNFLGGQLPNALIFASGFFQYSIALNDAYQASLLFGASATAISAALYSLLSQPALSSEKNPSSINQSPSELSLIDEFFRQIPSLERVKYIFKVISPHIVVGIGAGAVIPFIPLYLHQTFGASSSEIGNTMSLVQSAVAIGYLISPVLSRRFGVLQSAIIVQFASLPFMAVMGFSPSLWLVTVAFLFRNVLMNMSAPFVEQYHLENVRDEEREFAASMDIFFWNLSWSITPALAGMVIEQFGYKPLFLFTIAFYALSSLMYLFVLRQRNAKAATLKVGESVA